MRRLVLVLCLTAPLGPVRGIFENVAPPWLLTTQMQRVQPKRLPGLPRGLHPIPKLMYWKHLLELECMKEICGYLHHKDRSSQQSPFDVIRHRQMPGLRNDGTGHREQVRGLYRMREPQERRKYGGNERVILWPPAGNFTGKHPAGLTPALVKEQKGERHPEGQEAPAEDPFAKLFRKPSTENAPQEFRHSNRIQPYEVEEVIEENYEVDVDDDKGDGYGEGRKTEKAEEFESVIDDSVNTILKGLISPVMKTSPEKPSSSNLFFRAFTNYPLPDQTNANLFGVPWNLHPNDTPPTAPPNHPHTPEPTQQLPNTNPHRTDNSRRFHFTPPSPNHPSTNPLTTDSPPPPNNTLHLSPADTLRTLHLLRDLLPDHRPPPTTTPAPPTQTTPPPPHITHPHSPEFTDHPVSFDLLDTTARHHPKKDRKLHLPDPDQRRSDILISDDLPDYDDNALSTLPYLHRLRQNHSLPDPLNLTADALIPLLPVLINDLREGRVPPDDHPALAQALGRHWHPVLALSNLTNLDMLPLLKMKDEKDLETVLRSFLPQDPSTTTEDYDYNQSYDYMDEYKELYKDILGQEFGDKRRRFRPRRDAEDDLRRLEATREYFESLEEEEGDDGGDYIFEDIIYDEVSDGDSSVFELMEVADVVVEKA